MTRLIIHAPNIHQGGGAILLSELLAAIPPLTPAVALLDARFSAPASQHSNLLVKRFEPTVLSRFKAEVSLRLLVRESDRVLCFGNLPPLFRLKAAPAVFLQNRYVVDKQAPLCALPLKSRIRLHIEKIWLRNFRKNACHFVVQTHSMQRLTDACLGVQSSCFPFVPATVNSLSQVQLDQTIRQFDFVYVASGEAHKNHFALIEAWRLLSAEGLFPSLALTLSPELAPELCSRVERETISGGLRIHNLGFLSHVRLLELYRESGALIYPSSFESFGLPLIEARQAGLPVLAPELDYVRDVIDPHETFDPRSPVSIARAVMRHLKGRSPPLEIHSAQSWLNHFIADDLL